MGFLILTQHITCTCPQYTSKYNKCCLFWCISEHRNQNTNIYCTSTNSSHQRDTPCNCNHQCTKDTPKRYRPKIVYTTTINLHIHFIAVHNIMVINNMYKRLIHQLFSQLNSSIMYTTDMQTMLQQLLASRQNVRNENLTIKLSSQFLTSEELNSYQSDLKDLYSAIFNSSSQKIQLKKLLPFSPKKTQMPVCNKLFQNEYAYRCYDCLTHPAAILCVKCFQNGTHKGHRYQKTKAGGNCDCGNPQAMKQSGFCINHGHAISIQIDNKQREFFKYFIGTLFDWYFTLQKCNKKNASQLGMLLGPYLKQLNFQSVYYNTLTYQVLFSQVKRYNHNKIIKLLFEVRCENTEGQFSKMMLNMFSLQEFKYDLIVEFIRAYNSIQKFETSRFKELYCQLISNKSLTMRLLNELKLYIDPSEKDYEQNNHLQNLHFMFSIDRETAIKFYQLFLTNRFFEARFMTKQVQKCQNLSINVVQIIDTILNLQNMYELIAEKAFTLLRNNKQLYKQINKNYYHQLIKNNSKYLINQIILPYHRAFGLSLFIFNNFSIPNITIANLSTILQVSQDSIITNMLEFTNPVFGCLWQFALTFVRVRGFDNYIPLYVQSGLMNFRFDVLFIRIVTSLLSQIKDGPIKFAAFLNSFLKKKQFEYAMTKVSSQKMLEQNYEQYSKTVTALMGLLTQIIVSNRQQIMIGNDSKEQLTEQHNKEEELLICSFLSRCKQFTHESFKKFSRYFLGQYNMNNLQKIATFNTHQKKFKAKNPLKQQICFAYYPSFIKIPTTKFIDLQPTDFIIRQIAISQKSTQILHVIYSDQLIIQLIKSQQKSFMKKGIYADFLKQITKIYFLLNCQCKPIEELFQRIEKQNSQLFNQPELINLRNKRGINQQATKSSQNQISKKQRIQQIRNKRIKELKQKQSRAKKLLINEQIQNQNQNQDNKCIICREDEDICMIARVQPTNLLNKFFGQKTNSWSFMSCNHFIHMKCFLKSYGKVENFRCPFCSTLSNILIPLQNNYQEIKKALNLIGSRVSFMQTNYLKQNYEENIFIEIIDSFIQSIGFRSILNMQQFISRSIPFYHKLYLFAKNYYLQMNNSQQLKTNAKIIKYLQQYQNIKPSIKQHQIISQFIIKSLFKDSTKLQFNHQQYQSSLGQQLYLLYNSLIQKIINVQFPIQLPESSHYLNLWSSLLQSHYQIPNNIKQLLILRDTVQNTLGSYDTSLCCFCGEIGEKNKVVQHCNMQHCMKGIFLNLMNGELFCVFSTVQNKGITAGLTVGLGNPYENKVGKKWTPHCQGYQYDLDKELFKKSLLMYYNSTLEDYFEKHRPPLSFDLNLDWL